VGRLRLVCHALLQVGTVAERTVKRCATVDNSRLTRKFSIGRRVRGRALCRQWQRVGRFAWDSAALDWLGLELGGHESKNLARL
jgi:hypothetical protein